MHVHKFAVISGVLLATCLFLAGCAGTPRYAVTTDPVLLLPEESELYGAVYTKDNEAALLELASLVASDEQIENIKKMLPYTDMVYLSSESATNTVTLAIQGDFPTGMISFALTPKKGWTKVKKDIAGTPYKTTLYLHDSGVQVAFPSKELCIVSNKSVMEALEKLYSPESTEMTENRMVSAFFDEHCTAELPVAIYSYSPEKLLAAFIGGRNVLGITFGMSTVGLTLAPDSTADVWTGTIIITVSDPRTRNAVLFLVKALAGSITSETPCVVAAEGDDGILLKNITITADSMVKLTGSGMFVTGQ